ncbi:MAG: hypothetical protein NW223_23695 [Hyphomicrobiaceae bacterium]|nr:hypothetical protein [Hyphomicrobiaceae bacterium]
MYTLSAIGGGLAVLIVLILLARIIWGAGSAMSSAALWFIPIWFVISAVYVGYGIYYFGYSLAQEAPMFLLDFGVPAVVALILWVWLKPKETTA